MSSPDSKSDIHMSFLIHLDFSRAKSAGVGYNAASERNLKIFFLDSGSILYLQHCTWSLFFC